MLLGLWVKIPLFHFQKFSKILLAILMASDLAALKNYVTAHDGHEYDNLTDNLVVLNIQHSLLKMSMVDIRLTKCMTIGQVKEKIYRHCGTKPDSMTLSLVHAGQPIELTDESRPLGYYGVTHGQTLYVGDTDPFSLARNGGLEDLSLVQKYEMSEDEYAKRENTVRRYKADQLAKDPNWKPPSGPTSFLGTPMMPAPETTNNNNQQQQQAAKSNPASVADARHLTIARRCEVQPGARRGTLVFLGPVPELDGGFWAGVEFDEPVGRGNGSVRGTSYFKCGDKYGGFIRPSNVMTGDFPERDPFESDEEL